MLTTQKKGNLDDAKAKVLLDAARPHSRDPSRAAYQNLVAWQKEDQTKATEKAFGVGALPNGAAFYRERLANQTTTTLSADRIHQIGLDEVKRLRGEMDAIRKEVSFQGDLQAFFAELRDKKDDPRYYFPDTDAGRDAYIKEASAAIDKIKAVLPKYFGSCQKPISSSSASSRSASSPAPRSTTSPVRRMDRARAPTTRTCPT